MSTYPTGQQARERTAWGKQWGRCMVCRQPFMVYGPMTAKREIHEIARRGQAPKRWAFLENYLAVCKGCHESVLAAMPHAQQLAYKRRHDPDNFDPAAICRALSWAESAITVEDVDLAEEAMR